MNIAIMDGKFSKEAYDHILKYYNIDEIATREQIALECASPILLRMKVPIDQLENSVKDHSVLPVGAPSNYTYSLTTKMVYEAALSFVSGLYPFIELIRASADIGERICIAREVSPTVWRSLGFSVMTIAHERADFDLTVRLETEIIFTDIPNLPAALDNILQGKIARRVNDLRQIKRRTPNGFSFRIGTRTESDERLKFIADRMEETSKLYPEQCSRKNYQIWVRHRGLANTKPPSQPRPDSWGYNTPETYLLDSDCLDADLGNLIVAMMFGEPGSYFTLK